MREPTAEERHRKTEAPRAPRAGPRAFGAWAADWKSTFDADIDAPLALAVHLRAREALRHVVARLDEAGVPALVVKGAILAHTLYESPVARPMRDVDLRVRPEDLERAVDALVRDARAAVVRRSRVYKQAVVLVDGIEFDIETTIGPPYLSRLDVASMLARARRSVAPLGFSHWQPELIDHVLLLVTNLYKDHVVEASRWSVDDLLRIVQLPAFRSGELVTRAVETRTTTMLYVVAQSLAARDPTGTWAQVASVVVPKRGRRAAAILRGSTSESSPLSRRLRFRAGADGYLDSACAVIAGGLFELERRATGLRP